MEDWNYEITLNGEDVKSYVLDFKIPISRDSSDDGDGNWIKFVGSITEENLLKYGYELLIKRGIESSDEQFIFKGDVTNIKIDEGTITCNVRPPPWKLQNQTITEVFGPSSIEAGVITEMWKSVAAGENETINVSATANPDLPLLTYFLCEGETRWNRAQKLRKLIKYQSFYKPSTDTYYLEPEGNTAYPLTLEVGKAIMNVPKWVFDEESVINDVKINGAVADARYEEIFNGNGAEDTFTLSWIPKDTEVYVGSKTTANLQVFGVVDSTDTYNYYVDNEEKEVIFLSGSIPGAGTDNVIINYSYNQPRPVRIKDNTSIGAFGLRQTEVSFSETISVADATIQAQTIVDVSAYPAKSTTIQTILIQEIFPGYKVSIVDSINNINGDFTVNKVIYQYTAGYDVLEIGDRVYKQSDLVYDIIENIYELNKKGQNQNQQLVTEINNNKVDVYTHITNELYTAEPEDDVLYWDSEEQGEWDNFEWGDDDDEDRTLIKRLYSNNTFYDDFSSTQYSDTVNTTATIDTTDKQVEFTSGQIYRSDQVVVGGGSVESIVATWTVTGTVKVEFSNNDGESWLEATNSTSLSLPEASNVGDVFPMVFPITLGGATEDAIVKYRVTETGSSTAELSQIKFKYTFR